MAINRTRRDRGFALLLALVALSAVSVGAAVMLRGAVNVSLEARFTARAAEDRALLDDLEPLLTQWANENAGSPLPPGADGLDFRTILDRTDQKLSVRAAALDLSGRLRADLLDSFAALGLPRTLHRLDSSSLDPFGSAQETPPALIEEIVAALPRRDRGDVRAFSPADEQDVAPRVIACLWLTARGSGALNVKTAPVPLLREAMRGLPPSLSRRALVLRRAGEAIPDAVVSRVLAARAAARRGAEQSRHVALTDASAAFGFIVTIRRGAGLAKRWWLIAEPSPDPNSGTNLWRVVHRRRLES